VTAELSRPVFLNKIGPEGLTILVRATREECAAVAARMEIPAIQSLECLFHLTVDDDGATVHAEGRLRAQVTRVCVVSAEDFETIAEDEFTIDFVPSGRERDDPDPDLPDEIPYEGDTIDLGETTAEQLGLVLDPYPRMEGATLPDMEDDTDGSPFSALSRWPGANKTTH
jgi:hypothetical protein